MERFVLKQKTLFGKKPYIKNSFFLENGSRFWVPIWFPKTGDNEMQQTVGLHFVVPRFAEPNRYPKTGTIF